VRADVLLEPTRRDSGPAIAAGATYALRRGGDPVVVALAADHVVSDPLAFAKLCAMAGNAAQDDRIVMFGVQPTRAAIEYGYIRPGPPLAPELFAIERFVEKSDAETAARHVTDGYLWNSGNFVFRADFLLQEYRHFEPESAATVEAAIEGASADLGFVMLETTAFGRAAAKSIDYAVMERTERAAVMPVSYGWSDVGSWQGVWELSERDADDNAAQGSAIFVETRAPTSQAKSSTSRFSVLRMWSW
jgi:mannose-1-phosphate guanylyltransferase / mannose-6-phosphate isomerase